MHKSLLIFFSLLFNFCYGQLGVDSTTRVNLITYLSKGDTLKYTVVKTVTDSSTTKEPSKSEVTFDFTITVRDSTDSSYIFSYSRKLESLMPELMNLPIKLQKSLTALTDLQVDYETDEYGCFKAVLNTEQLTHKFEQQKSTVLELINQSDLQKDYIDKMEEVINSIEAESLISSYTQDILALHYALGSSFMISDTTAFDEDINIPIFDIPMSFSGIIYCDEYDSENSFISFIEEKKINGDFRKQMLGLLQSLSSDQVTAETEEEIKKLDMDLYLINNYQYNTSYGVPLYISLNKVVYVNSELGKHKRIETYNISLIE